MIAMLTWQGGTGFFMVSLDIAELNFVKKERGKKPVEERSIISFNLTRRQCVSKVAKVFELTGKMTPFTVKAKLDQPTLVEKGSILG